MNIIKIYKKMSTLIFGVFLALSSTYSTAGVVYSDVYVFGDSLSDTGNVRDSLGFLGGFLGNSIGYGGNGRFSNGDVWHEYLSDDLGLSSSDIHRDGGNNYAYGGALASGGDGITGAVALGMDEQIDQYIDQQNGVNSDGDALFITWVGGNDLRAMVGNANPFAELEQTLDNMAASLAQLLNNGVGTLLVPNLPDLGAIPEFANNAANSAQAHDLTVAWNTGLESRLTELNTLSNAELYYFDVFSIFNDLLDDPAYYGFINTSDECRSTTFFGERACANADQHLFWDYIHPTTAAHELLADFAFEQLASDGYMVPEPSTWAILMIGLLMIAVRRKKVR